MPESFDVMTVLVLFLAGAVVIAPGLAAIRVLALLIAILLAVFLVSKYARPLAGDYALHAGSLSLYPLDLASLFALTIFMLRQAMPVTRVAVPGVITAPETRSAPYRSLAR